MRTEVLVPFSFDTTPIEAMMAEQGKQEVLRVIENLVMDAIDKNLPKKSVGYGYSAEQVTDWRGYLDGCIKSWLDAHSEEVIDEAAMLLAAKASRKKAWREVLAEVKQDEKE